MTWECSYCGNRLWATQLKCPHCGAAREAAPVQDREHLMERRPPAITPNPRISVVERR